VNIRGIAGSAIIKDRVWRAVLVMAGLLSFLGLWMASYHYEWTGRGTMPDPFLLPAAFVDEWITARIQPAALSSLTHYL
jgi:hypothetical protein